MPEHEYIDDVASTTLDKTLLQQKSDEKTNDKICSSDSQLEKNLPQQNKLYARNVLTTFSVGLVDPFLTSFAIDMGITGSQMGWLRAITNLLGTLTQPIFGYISDTINRRNIFIALSNIFYSSIWLILLFIDDVIFLIVMAGFLSLAGSLGAPSWTALLGEVIPSKIRGKILAKVNWFSEFSYMISAIIGGLIFNFVLFTFTIGEKVIHLNILLPITIGLIVGLSSGIVILTFNEKKAKSWSKKISEQMELTKTEKTIDQDLCTDIRAIKLPGPPRGIISNEQSICITDKGQTSILRKRVFHKSRLRENNLLNNLIILTKNHLFLKLVLFFVFQQFFMSMIWPLYPIRQYDDIPDVGYFEIAIFQVVMSLAFVLTIRYSGIISDYIGRKPQIFLNCLILAFMPLAYAFSTRIWHIIAINSIFCVFLGLTSTATMAYIIDITPEKTRSMYIGIFNMMAGIVLFLGSLFGGYLLDFLMGEISIFGWSYNFDQFTAVSIGFVIGFIGRLLSSFPFLLIKEVKIFPIKLRELPKLAFKSKRFPILSISIIIFLAITLGSMFLLGYLP